MAQRNKAQSIVDVIDKLENDLNGGGMTVGDLVDEFGSRSFGPIITLLGLACLTPLGAIPGVPAIIGACLILICGQIIIGNSRLWLPQNLRSQDLDKDEICKAINKGRPIVRRVDRVIKVRWEHLFTPVSKRLAAGLCILLAIALVPLELIPFAVSLPALALTFLGLSFTNHDGFLLVAGVVTALTSAIAFMTLL